MAKKDDISNKALELFLEKGYDQTPISDIAKGLGASKGGLYHYFSNKEDLLYYIIDNLMSKKLNPIIEKAESMSDPEKRLKFFLKNFIKLLTEDDSTRLVMHDSKRLDPQKYKMVRGYFLRVYNLIYNSISQMESQRTIKRLDKAFATFGVIGMCSWIFYWFDYSRKESSERLARTYIDIFFNGIKKDS